MGNMSAIGQRVRRRMLEMNIGTIKELEQRAGLTKDTIRHLIAGRTTTIRSSKLPGLAQALEMSLDELVHGDKVPGGEQSSVTMPLSTQEHPDASLGRIRFDSQALPSFGITDGEPSWVVAQSDNMHPTICIGDIVLIDAAVKKVESDGVYCIMSASGVFTFRRVQTLAVGGSVSLTNDNPKYLAEANIQPSALKIAGKALGSFRRF